MTFWHRAKRMELIVTLVAAAIGIPASLIAIASSPLLSAAPLRSSSPPSPAATVAAQGARSVDATGTVPPATASAAGRASATASPVAEVAATISSPPQLPAGAREVATLVGLTLTSVSMLNAPTLNFRVLNQSAKDFIGRIDYADIAVTDSLGATYGVICCYAGPRAFTVPAAGRYDFSVPLGPNLKPAATTLHIALAAFSGARDLTFTSPLTGPGNGVELTLRSLTIVNVPTLNFRVTNQSGREFFGRVDYGDIIVTDNVGTTYSVICCYAGARGFTVPAAEHYDFGVPLGPNLHPAASELTVLVGAFSGATNLTFRLRL